MAIVMLPRLFWTDHYERCSEHPGQRVVLREAAKTVTVQMDVEALTNLRSDAEYYGKDGLDQVDARLCRSARATLRALDAAT